jgi:hypothetical protein
VRKDRADHVRILDERDNFYDALAIGAAQRVHFKFSMIKLAQLPWVVFAAPMSSESAIGVDLSGCFSSLRE